MSKRIRSISLGERLLIDRRRRNEHQYQAAERLGLSRVVYGRWERDEPLEEDGKWPEGQEKSFRIKIGRLRPNEQCLLHRRRAQRTQADVAEEFGCCRWTINRIESGFSPAEELLRYWEQ